MDRQFSARNFEPNNGPNPSRFQGRKGHFASKPLTHGGGAALVSWIGAGCFVLGIILGAISGTPIPFWVFAGLAVQLWIVGMIIRPIEAVFTLLNERLPRNGR